MNSRALALALVVLTALVTGAAVTAAPIGSVKRTNVPAAGLSLALPSAWKLVDAKTAGKIAKETLAQENPQLAGILAELDRPGTGLVFFAFDPKGAEQFATNVNIVISRIPNGVTLAQLAAASKSELSRIPGRVGLRHCDDDEASRRACRALRGRRRRVEQGQEGRGARHAVRVPPTWALGRRLVHDP